jgi:hypothetical protein
LRCGPAPDHPRVVAARDWLVRHFDPASKPATYDPVREAERDASHSCWCWSAAQTL